MLKARDRMVKKAVYYGRVSTEEQALTGYSLDMQKEKCLEWAKNNDCEIVEFFEDRGKSGSSYKNLKSLQALNKYIRKNRIQCVIVWKIDRLSRNIADFYAHTYKNLSDLEMTLYSVTDPITDLMNDSQTVLGCLLGVATDEVLNTKKRTKATMLHRAQQGYLMGKAPIGYLNKQVNGHGIIVKDEKNAPHIVKIFSLYGSGQHTMKSISLEVYKDGFHDKNGKPYTARKIEHILKNIVYTGKIKYGKNEDGTDRIIQGKHEPIVPLSLFNKVQSLRRNDGQPYATHTDKTYSKMIRCTCGCFLTGYHSKGAHNSGDYIYYKCHNRKQAHIHIKGIKQETLDETFNSIFAEIHIPKKVVELIKPKLVKALDEIYSTENQVYMSNAKRLTELNTLMKTSNEERLLGCSHLSNEEFDRQMQEWQDEKIMLSENNKTAAKVNKTVYSNIDTLMKFLSNIGDTYKNASIENKQRLLRMVCDKVTYDTETEELTVKLKPIFQALIIIKDNEHLCSKKVTTLPKVSSKTVLDYLTKNIEISLKNKVTTLKKLSITEKEPTNETLFVNGAPDGIRTHAYRNHNPRS